MKLVYIEQTLGFKQLVRHFGGDRHKAHEALSKAFSTGTEGRDYESFPFSRQVKLDGMFIWHLTPQGKDYWAAIHFANVIE